VIGSPAPILDQVDLPRPGRFHRFPDGAPLHLGDPGGDGDDDPRPDQGAAVVDAQDEVPQHRLRDVEIGDHAVPHGPDGDDVARRPSEHLFGFRAHGQDLLFPLGVLVDGDDGRFVQHDPLSPDIYEGVGRPQIDGQIVGKFPQNKIEKQVRFLLMIFENCIRDRKNTFDLLISYIVFSGPYQSIFPKSHCILKMTILLNRT
jgi:hypothetical protein